MRRLVDYYPDSSLRYDNAGGDWAAHCTSLIRWLQSRTAVAVLYATGLRPSDLDAIRWHDLRTGDDGTIMWRLPYSKGNRHGDRVQVLRLAPTGEPWCPIKALRRLALSVREARTAGWQGRTAEPDSDGTVRRVFAPHIGADARRCLMVPAGVAIRPQDFRYRKAAPGVGGNPRHADGPRRVVPPPRGGVGGLCRTRPARGDSRRTRRNDRRVPTKQHCHTP